MPRLYESREEIEELLDGLDYALDEVSTCTCANHNDNDCNHCTWQAEHDALVDVLDDYDI